MKTSFRFLFAVLAGALSLGAASQPSAAAADQALRELKAAATPLKPLALPAGQKKTKEQADEERRLQTAAFVAAAEKAKEFYSTYPDHPGAAEARKIEVVSLLRAARGGSAEAEAGATAVAQGFVDDDTNSRRDRYVIASMLKQRAVEKKAPGDPAALLSEYEKNAAELYAEYADVPEVYHLFLGLARNSPEAKARQLAADLLAKPAPPEVKAEAQAILDRLDMPGKTIDLKFITDDAKVFNLEEHRGKPVVLYFWSGRGRGSVTALPLIRDAAAGEATFVGFNIDPDWVAARKALGDESIPGAQGWDPRGFSGDVPRQLRLEGVPRVYVFDAQGVLRGFGHPRELSALLAKSAE